MSGLNIGHSSRLIYDSCAYNDRLSESVGPLLYQLNPGSINNCNACLSVFGPRTSQGAKSYGVSNFVGNQVAPSQKLVDVESILSNRNVLTSKCKDGQVNDIDVTQFQLANPSICNDYLDPVASRLTNPSSNYRGMAINRFYDLDRPIQNNIFWDFAINTRLESADNYIEYVPQLIRSDPTLPNELKGRNKPCRTTCYSGCPGKNDRACTYNSR